MTRRIFIPLLAIGAAMFPVTAYGQSASETVTFSAGTLTSFCILTIDLDGTLALSSDGNELGTEQAGGVSALVTVSAVGSAVSVTYADPVLSAPAGDSGSLAEFAYTSTGGASAAYSSTGSTSAEGLLLDVYTVDGRITNSNGFAAGDYSMTVDVSCSQ